MSDEKQRNLEMRATLRQIQSIRNRRAKPSGGRRWRLDVSLSRLALQGAVVFGVGLLVGLGLFVLFRVLAY